MLPDLNSQVVMTDLLRRVQSELKCSRDGRAEWGSWRSERRWREALMPDWRSRGERDAETVLIDEFRDWASVKEDQRQHSKRVDVEAGWKRERTCWKIWPTPVRLRRLPLTCFRRSSRR